MSPTPPTLVLLFTGLAAAYTTLCLLNMIAVQHRQRVQLHTLRAEVTRLRHSYAVRIKRLRDARFGPKPQITPQSLIKPITPPSLRDDAVETPPADQSPPQDEPAPRAAA